MDGKLDMSQQCILVAHKASCILGCIKRSMISRSREGILPFYSALVRPHLEYCIQMGSPQNRTTTVIIQGMEHLPWENRELGLFSLEKRRVWGNPRAAFQYLKGGGKKGGGQTLEQDMIGQSEIRTFYSKGGEALAQVAQRRSRSPILEDIRGQAEQGSEQPDAL